MLSALSSSKWLEHAEVLKDSRHVIDDAMEAVGQTKRVYGARLLVRGLLWVCGLCRRSRAARDRD